jgi:hypothetical protein
MATPLITPAPKLLDVRPDIIKRGEKLFGPDGIDAENKSKADDRYQGLPEYARPKLDSQTGKARADGTLLDPLNVLGLRQRTIDKLVEEGGQNLINSYDSQTGKYSGLSGWNRTLDGITDDDITKAILRRNNNMRQSDPEFQENLAELDRQGVKVDSLTTNLSIKDQAQEFKDIRTLTESIRGMDEGPAALQTLGDKPTKSQLQDLQTQLKPKQRAEIRTQQSHDSSLETADVQRDVAQQNAATNAGQLGLNTTIADNNQTLAIAKLAHADKVAQQNVDIANIKIRNQQATANADRELRRDLAMLTRGDAQDERAYRRERDERKDRQMMILQLMNGLKQMGQSFAL